MIAAFTVVVGLLTLLAAAPQSVFAAQSTVCPNLGQCNYTTIFDAVNAAQSNDVILVQAGNYTEQATTMSKPLAFVAMGGEVQVNGPGSTNAWLNVYSEWATNGSFVLNEASVILQSGGTWIQNGNANAVFTMVPNIVGALCGLCVWGGTWIQNGNVSVVTSSTSSYGVLLGVGGSWTQEGHASFMVSGIESRGVESYTGGTWIQNGDVNCVVQGSPINTLASIGLIALGGTWNQYGNVRATVDGNIAWGVNVVQSGIWEQIGNLSITIGAGATGSFGVVFSSTWHQFGKLDISVAGMDSYGVCFVDGTDSHVWEQMGDATLEVIGMSCCGVYMYADQSVWNQTKHVRLTVGTGNSSSGVCFLGSGSEWNQFDDTDMVVSGTSSNGVLFNGTGQTWTQNGNLSVTISGIGSCGVNLNNLGREPWRNNGHSALVVLGQESYGVCPPPLPSPSSAAIQASFDQTTPSVTVGPMGEEPTQQGQHVQFDFLSLEEISPNGTVVQQASLQDGGWQAYGKGSLNVGQILAGNANVTFMSTLSNYDNAAAVQYTFATFASPENTTLGNNYSFIASPQYLKFSLRLAFWNWTSTTNRLQFAMRVQPAFNTSERRNNTPQQGITTLWLHSAEAGQASALVRLLDFGLDAANQMVNCSIGTANNSSVTMTFDYFGSYLDYDPDLSLLLGQANGGPGSSNNNLGLIVGVAVAVPAAVVLVGLVIGFILVVGYIRARRNRKGGQVNFDQLDGGVEDAEL